MTTMQQLGIENWPVEARIKLMGELWDSLENEEFPMTPEQEAELNRRIDLYEADPLRGSPWEEVKARLRFSR